MTTNGAGAPGSEQMTGGGQMPPEREDAPLSRNACILRLVFGVFLLLWLALRWLVTTGGILGAFGVGFVFVVPVLLLVLFGDQDWFARDSAGGDGSAEVTTLGTVLLVGFFLGGIALWIIGIVRKRAARARQQPAA